MSGMNTVNNFRRKSLSGGGTNEGHKTVVVAEVKHVREAPDKRERRIDVKLEERDARNNKMSIYAPVDVARKLAINKKYEFELEDDPFRGGGQSCFNTMKEVKRTSVAPSEVSGFSGSGGGRMNDRFGKGFAGSHMDFF
jgi:hypothetical protein